MTSTHDSSSQRHVFVHLGDLHLRGDARNAGRLQSLDAAIAYGDHEKDLRGWLWPGDLNHGAMTITDRNALSERIMQMAQYAPVVICYGNHDRPGDLDVFGRLHGKHPISVVGTTTQYVGIHRKPCGDLLHSNKPDYSSHFSGEYCGTVMVVPYPTKASLLAQGLTGADLLEEGGRLLGTHFETFAREEVGVRPDVPCLVIGHFNVAGSQSSAGQPQIGREIEVNPADMRAVGEHTYIGLNHIHKQQTIQNAHYAGSMARMDWGETEEKSFNCITFQGSRLMSVVQIQLFVPPMFHIDAEVTEQGHIKWPRAADLPSDFDVKGSEVRVRYTFPASSPSVVDSVRQVIEDEFSHAARLVIEPLAQGALTPRSAAVQKATTTLEKLNAWSNHQYGRPLTIDESVKADALINGESIDAILGESL